MYSMKNLKNQLSHLPDLANFDRDDLLGHLGLARKQDTFEKLLPAFALFGAGIAVGVGLGMILAPRSGQELRGELQSQFKRVEQKVRGAAEQASATIASAVPTRPT